jgi:hypothetical protein
MAVTITYINPGTVGTFPPTAVEMLPLSRVTVRVAFAADTDTTALITHNMNIPLASTPTQHGQNSGSPWVTITPDTTSAGTVAGVISFTRGTNTLTLNKLATVAGTNCTVEVNIERYEPLL